ncbi:MAG: ABC transporter substrate-binding protein [Phycisphaerales bacterium]
MQNRFGLKDFVVIVLLLGLGVSIWLAMFQRDREWTQLQTVQGKLTDLERQLSRVAATLDSGIAVAAAPAPGAGSGGPGAGAAAPARDESWARPGGVKVEWQPPWTYSTDPRSDPRFVEGGSFTEIFDAQPAKLTPYIQTDVYGRRAVDIVMQPLAAYDPQTLRLRGVLAEAWQMDPGGMWVRARIHDRARWSDGEPITAEDVRFVFHDYIMNPQIEAQRYRSTLTDKIARVEVISERVVEFTFKEAMFDNLDSALTLWPLPKHFYGEIAPADINKSTGLLVGSGPYKFEHVSVENQWRPGEPIVLVRNEQYWGARTPLDRLAYLAINDELPRLTAYRNGEGDMTTPSAPQFDSLIKDERWSASNQNLNWVNMKSGNSFIAWNCAERNGRLTPFHDRRVRLAMTHLIDREKMIRDIWKGIGVISKGSAIPISPASNPDNEAWPFDLTRAKELLKEAGWEDRDRNGVLEDKDGHEFVFEFTFSTGGEISQRIALFVQDSCKAAGIKCTLRGVDWSVSDPIRKQRDFDAITLGWGANAPESDPKQIFHSNSIKDQGDNFAQWNNPEADRLIDEGRRELDFDKRMKIWHQFEMVMHHDQPYTWVRVQPFVRFVKPEIGNVHTYRKGIEPWEFFRASGPGGASVTAGH